MVFFARRLKLSPQFALRLARSRCSFFPTRCTLLLRYNHGMNIHGDPWLSSSLFRGQVIFLSRVKRSEPPPARSVPLSVLCTLRRVPSGTVRGNWPSRPATIEINLPCSNRAPGSAPCRARCLVTNPIIPSAVASGDRKSIVPCPYKGKQMCWSPLSTHCQIEIIGNRGFFCACLRRNYLRR